MLDFDLPPPEIRGKGSSSFTVEDIDRRLAALREMEATEEVARELQFLQDLRERYPGR